ncbi:flagellar assembly protein T N-terminal domain-containing protein [Marinobacter arenosus]|uniref:flagellar assembly protein T N-terminal domain-containing protein n=1 Tax=Marinobacter arenosus TaxID=2856822 RepID=UPI001C4CD770|nr:flagellar assembly protein T N-terminal domain-containing protein [Marinobacter arenosus]MBW0147400.1 flagella assembly protein FlgT [Marinobacter arenosus]
MALRRILLTMLLTFTGAVHAIVLEGVGHGTIVHGDLESARADARQAALRDLALQYEARVSTRDTMENGVVTESRMQVAASARARNARVVDEYRSGNLLRVTVRADMSDGQGSSCGAGEAAGLRKRVAITGFPVLYPDQARIGRIDDAGEVLPQQLQDRLRAGHELQVFGATTTRMFDDLLNAPTVQQGDNRLTNVLQLARELGAQFVVTGVIRDLGVADPSAWGTSVLDRMQRSLGAVDQNRRFVVDLMIFDGFSGSPVFQHQFSATAEWNAGPGASDGFGSAGFRHTAYGQAVNGVVDQMVREISGALACQPFMTRVTRVDGNTVTLASGATAGLRPGDELHLYRSARYFDSLGGTPELRDAKLSVILNNVHPDFSNGRMPTIGTQVNIQRDDIAIVW